MSLRNRKLTEIALAIDPNHSDAVLIYVSGAKSHYGRAWYGGTSQEAVDIVDAWRQSAYTLARVLLRGKGCTTGHGRDICDAIDAHLAAQHYSPTPDPSDDDSASDENYALDASDPDTWGIGNKPHARVKQWEPDTPDPAVDLMKSIRDVCHR